MKKCPNCGYEEEAFEAMSFETFMNLTIKRVANKQMEEYGYGIQEKPKCKKRCKKRSKEARKQ
jgi:hypothetical protein